VIKKFETAQYREPHESSLHPLTECLYRYYHLM